MTMDYEKKYKEALERAREYHSVDIDNTMDVKARGIMEYLFPELQESEDERVRREIMDFIDTQTIYSDERRNRWFSYLENQCETYTKRDVDNAYIEGMAFAKDELEKQAEVESDNDDIEAEEEGIRKAFNKIWEEKQDKQKSQRMISAEAKEAMYNKPADKVEPKCEESETKIFDAPTPFEDKLYAFVAACEFLAIPSKIEFILEHSQEILDAAKEQIGKEWKPTWSEEDETGLSDALWAIKQARTVVKDENDMGTLWYAEHWLTSLKTRYAWKPSDEQLEALKNAIHIKPFKNPSDSILWRLYEQLNKLK